eukprot:m51a1_g8576 hypothetical protein (330) ;mRNA; r:209064-210115
MGQKIVRQMAFLPPPPSYDESLPNLWVPKRSGRGRIPACFIPAGSSGTPRRRAASSQAEAAARDWVPLTVVFTHGNAEDMGQMQGWMGVLAERLRVNVLSYDYTGYGLNAGEPTEQQCYDDIRAVYAHATLELRIPPRALVLWGRSIGSGPTAYLAALLCAAAHPELGCPARGALGGLVLQSGIASCVRVVSNALALLPLTDMFLNTDRMPAVTAPALVLHGTADDVVPFAHAQALWDRLRPAARWRFVQIEGAGHNDIEVAHSALLLASLAEFLDHVEARALAADAAAADAAAAPDADEQADAAAEALAQTTCLPNAFSSCTRTAGDI